MPRFLREIRFWAPTCRQVPYSDKGVSDVILIDPHLTDRGASVYEKAERG